MWRFEWPFDSPVGRSCEIRVKARICIEDFVPDRKIRATRKPPKRYRRLMEEGLHRPPRRTDIATTCHLVRPNEPSGRGPDHHRSDNRIYHAPCWANQCLWVPRASFVTPGHLLRVGRPASSLASSRTPDDFESFSQGGWFVANALESTESAEPYSTGKSLRRHATCGEHSRSLQQHVDAG